MQLLNQIENEKVDNKKLIVYYLGQSGYVLKTNNTIIYIDPYLSDYVSHTSGLYDKEMVRNYPPPFLPSKIQKLDAVFCTHSHVDHMDPWTIQNINADFNLYCSIGAYDQSPVKYPIANTVFLEPGKKVMVNDFIIEPISAAHYQLKDKQGRPDCLSFMIEYHNKTLFFWGDGIIYNGLIERLIQKKFDYFFAPINGRDKLREQQGIVGNLKARELAELCRILHIKKVIPNHYDMFKNNTESIEYFNECIHKICPNQNTLVMNCRDKIEA